MLYIFLGMFCITDPAEPGCCSLINRQTTRKATKTFFSFQAFAFFPIFFEVVSAYGSVGLSHDYPTVSTSLCGQFTTFSKLVICAMMIPGGIAACRINWTGRLCFPHRLETLGRDEETLERSLYYPSLKRLKVTYGLKRFIDGRHR
ncbi:hypothetical protein BDW75DRAFT_29245 [Aspergillus navahoensis]